VHWISAEPLLGPVDLTSLAIDRDISPAFIEVNAPQRVDALRGTLITDLGFEYELKSRGDWVVAGGESGKAARPMHPDWVRSLPDQCAAAGTPFFFKQWGEWWEFDGDACDAETGKHLEVDAAGVYARQLWEAGEGRDCLIAPDGRASTPSRACRKTCRFA
jgi:protein gp37